MKEKDIYEYSLLLADSSLIMGHRLSEWTGHGPMLEQDIAITNIALDLIGQARNFYQYAANIQCANGQETTEDHLAYLRDAKDYKNVLLVELPNGDWAQSIAKVFLFATWQYFTYGRLIYSPDKSIAAIAEKSLKEVTYHVKWSSEWMKRLGDGTEESHSRLQSALDYLWPYTGEMLKPEGFEKSAFEKPDFDAVKKDWMQMVMTVFSESTLTLPDPDAWMQSGGKKGVHTEHLGYILAEMQFLQRAYPGCEW